MSETKDEFQVVTRNRKARHSYEIISTLEAGIELMGTEVKSIREGKINLADSYAIIENGQVYLKNLHITPYAMASDFPADPTRPRRLLLHKREIGKLTIKTQQRGMALVPLSVYFKGKHVKIELALAVGRKKFDKRQVKAKEEADRRIKQAMRKESRK